IDNVDVSSSELQGSNYGPSPFLDTPNSMVNWRGRLTNDFENEITVQGEYVIPKIEVRLSTDYRYVSGQTYTKVARALHYMIDPAGDPNDPSNLADFNQGRVRYFAEPRGQRRLDATSILNFRLEKILPFKGGTHMGVFADAFNLMNRGEDLSVITRRGSSF